MYGQILFDFQTLPPAWTNRELSQAFSLPAGIGSSTQGEALGCDVSGWKPKTRNGEGVEAWLRRWVGDEEKSVWFGNVVGGVKITI